MAEKKSDTPKKTPRRRKEPETVRQKAEKEAVKRTKPTQMGRVKSKVHKPLSTLGRVAKKEYHPIKAPDNKVGRVLNKRVKYIPDFLVKAWRELRQVTWPTKKEAVKLTFAVIIFSIAFAILVQALDFVFSKVVKEIILR